MDQYRVATDSRQRVLSLAIQMARQRGDLAAEQALRVYQIDPTAGAKQINATAALLITQAEQQLGFPVGSVVPLPQIAAQPAPADNRQQAYNAATGRPTNQPSPAGPNTTVPDWAKNPQVQNSYDNKGDGGGEPTKPTPPVGPTGNSPYDETPPSVPPTNPSPTTGTLPSGVTWDITTDPLLPDYDKAINAVLTQILLDLGIDTRGPGGAYTNSIRQSVAPFFNLWQASYGPGKGAAGAEAYKQALQGPNFFQTVQQGTTGAAKTNPSILGMDEKDQEAWVKMYLQGELAGAPLQTKQAAMQGLDYLHGEWERQGLNNANANVSWGQFLWNHLNDMPPALRNAMQQLAPLFAPVNGTPTTTTP